MHAHQIPVDNSHPACILFPLTGPAHPLLPRPRRPRRGPLTLNRGEGGQNAMISTGDFEDAPRPPPHAGAARLPTATPATGRMPSAPKSTSASPRPRKNPLPSGTASASSTTPSAPSASIVPSSSPPPSSAASPAATASTRSPARSRKRHSKPLPTPTSFLSSPPKASCPGSRSRSTSPASPMQAITDKGLFDYATGQYAPARFTNYVTGEVTTTAGAHRRCRHPRRRPPIPILTGADGEAARSYVQFARIGLGMQKVADRPRHDARPAGAGKPSTSTTTAGVPTLPRCISRKARSRASSMAQPPIFDGIDGPRVTGIQHLHAKGFPTDRARTGSIESATARSIAIPSEAHRPRTRLSTESHCSDLSPSSTRRAIDARDL